MLAKADFQQLASTSAEDLPESSVSSELIDSYVYTCPKPWTASTAHLTVEAPVVQD